MAIEILYFAWVREQIGLDREAVDPPVEVGTVAALIDWLAKRSEAHGRGLGERARLRAAVDGRFADPEAAIAGAREVAIFPPVTGG